MDNISIQSFGIIKFNTGVVKLKRVRNLVNIILYHVSIMVKMLSSDVKIKLI